jgi:bifunctional ADP-heptose synthase (sugar kinase/adenylyltransferase)
MNESAPTQQQTSLNVLLIGDNCTDVYQYGTVDRISPEAPVPVFKFVRQEEKPGMAGNVYQNLEKLGCAVTYLHTQTTRKIRLIDSRSRQHVLRIDEDAKCDALAFTTAIPAFDAIVISDYCKGTVTYELIESIRKDYKGPIFVDTKKHDLKRLEGCYVKINQHEHEQITSRCSNLIVTLGGAGAAWDNEIFPAPSVEVSDVCGAGDTFLAALTYWYIKSKNMEQSIKFAIMASSVTVQHLGCYAPTLEEIL